MAYKKGKVVVSVPLTVEDNQKLHKLSRELDYKSKTALAQKLLSEAIRQADVKNHGDR